MNKEIVKVLLNNKRGNYIRERGEPVTNPFIWLDPEVNWLEWELEFLIHKLFNDFSYNDRYLRYRIRLFLWELYQNNDPTEKEIIHHTNQLIESLKIKVQPYIVLWSIVGLEPLKQSLVIDNIEMGTLDSLCDKKLSRQILKRIENNESKLSVIAKTIIHAPEPKLAEGIAKFRLDECLSLLSSTDPRNSGWLGDFYGLNVGEEFFIIDYSTNKLIHSGFRRGNQRPVPVSFPIENWTKEEHYRWKAPPRPWEQFSDDWPMHQLLKSAYFRFGQATRNLDRPDACICFAISAIETPIQRTHAKLRNKEVICAFILLASAEGKSSIPNPSKIINNYNLRNKILHNGFTLGTGPQDWMKNMLWDIYSVLDSVSNIALKNKTKDSMELMKALSKPKNIKVVTTTINKELKLMNDNMKKVSASQTKVEIYQEINDWKGYKRALKTITTCLGETQKH